ncbi:MAG TPA: RHS repeat-associated core domain-containing protein [Vicinamibacterales bacterium]
MTVAIRVRRLAWFTALSLAIAMALGHRSTMLDAQGAPRQTLTGTVVGQSATQLTDGRWLLVGGVGAERAAVVWDPQRAVAVPLGTPLEVPRAFHTATLLADGRVLIVGGRQATALAEVAEVFDPADGQFTLLAMRGSTARADQTATLLTDGRVLVVGGTNGTGTPLPSEVWDVTAQTVTTVGTADRANHRAALTSDGRVVISGGTRVTGQPAGEANLVDPETGVVSPAAPPAPGDTAAVLAGSIPANGTSDVVTDTRIALRFSEPLAISTVAPGLELRGPNGPVVTRVVVAEQGRLAFVWPVEPLEEDTTYEVRVSEATSAAGRPVVPALVTFTTKLHDPHTTSGSDTDEPWTPDRSRPARDQWRTDRPPSPWEALPPLMAPPGVTAISGRALTLDGQPLPDVTFSVDGGRGRASSDHTGRFLLVLDPPTPGRRVLHIDGGTVHRGHRKYGFFEYGAMVTAGQTNVLSFTVWMPVLDTAHAVRIPSPTTSEVVVTTPYIPGLELHIPPGTVLRGRDGKPVHEVSLTPIPIDRPPFPLAANVDVPVYFTAQPGGTYVDTSGPGPKGAWLVYPNYRGAVPGQRVQFFHYDPDDRGWYVYGTGRVTPDGTQVSPDPPTRLYEFTGAMINTGASPAAAGGKPGGKPEADPIDPATGVFLLHKTDLYLPDTIPLALTRTYNSGDTLARPFGTGMTHPYAMFLWSAHQYTEADLVLPEGGLVHFVRTSPGTSYTDAEFVHQETATTSATPTTFYKATLLWNGNGWNLTLRDGTVYVFGENAPLQAIRDRYGNTVLISHAVGQGGNVTQVTSPNGRWLAFTYDASNRITQVADNIGRTVTYAYTNGDLTAVTDPEHNVTTYAYDASHRLVSITDGRHITYLTNTYTSGRVTGQTLADPSDTYTFSYTVNGAGAITQTDITDPRGFIKRLAFNGDGYATSETEALGEPEERTTTTERQTGSNLVTASVDGLSRRTEYTYDTNGQVLTVTNLAGTTDAVTTTYTYEPMFNQLATVTDPLTHTWTLTYDGTGRLTGSTDPLTHHTGVSMNTAGQVTSVTDPMNHTWQYGYLGGDRVSTTNPLGAVWTQFVDAAGRVLATATPLGQTTRTALDKLNRTTAVVDALGGQTSFSYDANSNLTALTDALTHTTSYAYDDSDRVATRTDPLSHAASYGYDGNDNLTSTTDRKGQVTSRTYDALNRLHTVTFDDSSTITYTYDAGDRATTIVDSANGTINRTYDGLDRLTEEATAEGTVDYTYDADGRRATMTVAGQTAVGYAFDDAHRLTSITQGTDVVAFTYDDANRRSSLTYPNGIVATYGYDTANQLISLAYTAGATMLGDLAYTYNAAGQRTAVGGSWARTGIPAAMPTVTYDAANRIVSWNGTSFAYDSNGNITGDATNTYVWNARNQLASLIGDTTASFAYDGSSRRRQKTVSGVTTNFLYDGLNAVQELSGAEVPTANLLTGVRLDEVFRRSDASGARDLLTDALGSTVELADSSGTLQTHYTYEPFGATSRSGASSANAANFTGRENDGTGLYFSRARYFSPLIQRFVAEDPIGFAGGLNVYSYVADNPLSGVDPLGLFVRNCTNEPIIAKPENAHEPPVIVPPMSEWDGSPDGVRPWPGGPWVKTPSPNGWNADVVVYPGGDVQCLSGACAHPWFPIPWPLRGGHWYRYPHIVFPDDPDWDPMRRDGDWKLPPIPAPPDHVHPIDPKKCCQK